MIYYITIHTNDLLKMESTFPTGPPTCGSSEDPTCKVWITKMSHGGPLAVFGFWILVFVAILSFQLYRAAYARKHPSHPVIRGRCRSSNPCSRSTLGKNLRSTGMALAAVKNDESHSGRTPVAAATELVIGVDEAEHDKEPILRFTGYQTVVAGEMCWWLLILTSIHWMCIYVLVLLDEYYSCQLTGIDNLCFYGTYFIFGSYDRNGTVFFTVWCLSVMWFTTLVVYKREVHNWFMMPCGLSSAHVVHVWAQDQKVVLSVNVSHLVHLVRRLKGTYLSRPERRGHTETLRVQRTELGTMHFLFQGQRYLIAGDSTLHLAQVELGNKYGDLYKLSEGLSSEDALARYDKVGPNEVPFKMEAMWVSIAEEMFTLFKVYQFLMYSIWLWFSYLLVGGLLLSIVLIAAAITVTNRRRSQSSIAKLTEYESVVEVKRDGTWRNVDFRMLVPGDVVKVKSNWKLPCDLLVIQGTCVCNESNLTGEAMPVHKYKAPGDGGVAYEPESARGARHTLFAGTLVLQAGAAGSSTEVLAVVTTTGMSTSRGRLLSTILFPEQMVFKYDEELPIAVGLLLCYAVVCFALSLVFQYRNGQQSGWITKWSYCVAIVSQIVSPLLPVALETGQIYASQRLKNHGVYCLNAKRIAIAGKIRVFCFDKTGTLTNDGLDFVGIQGVEHIFESSKFQFRPTQSPWKHELIDDVTLRGFATCHSVTKFGAQFVGNEVEVKMFSSVGWELLEEGTAAQQFPVVINQTTGDVQTIVRRNEFEHARATMSVVVQDHTGELHVYCKGSFERIQELSTVASLPSDYLQTAKDHALDGCYVLGLGHKSLGTGLSLDAIKMLSRDDLETGLNFICLLLFRNELKSDTRTAIGNLRDGEVRPLMVTGDNAQCGFYIAKEAAMVGGHVQVLLAEIKQDGSLEWQPMARTVSRSSTTTAPASLSTSDMRSVHQKGLEGGLVELAVTGKAFNELCISGNMQELLQFTRIFARCSPEDKVKVINLHKDLGLVVGMCGDGGNDCGALRSAHAGVALSEAEASVVSPFTSKAKSVSSVVEVLREGRAALHTSFACYKFLIIYGLSFSIFKLSANWYGIIACQMDYLFIDGVAVLALGYTMNLSSPLKTFRKERPTSSLLGAQNVASVLGMWSINVLFVAGALLFMSAQSDYVKWPAQLSQGKSWWTLGDNWESTVIFFTIYFQFITSSVVFTFGSSFRRTLFRNYLLVGSWAGIFAVVSMALVLPHSPFTHLWHVASEQFNGPDAVSPVWMAYQQHGGAPSPAMSFSFRLRLWILSLANFVMVALWQKVVVEGPVATILRKKFPSATPKLHL